MQFLESSAVFSDCRTWRYTLTRVWDSRKPPVQFIGLNPSTADEILNDPTVTRCINYAVRWGFGKLFMTNIFAYRSTDPRNLRKVDDPVGVDNDYWILQCADESRLIVGAWGNHGKFLNRSQHVIEIVPKDKFKVLGVTKMSEPKHPLYLRADLQPVDFF